MHFRNKISNDLIKLINYKQNFIARFRELKENENTNGIVIIVATGDLLNRNGGALYKVANKIPKQQKEVVIRSAFITRKINRPLSTKNIIKNQACFSERSPEGMGK